MLFRILSSMIERGKVEGIGEKMDIFLRRGS